MEEGFIAGVNVFPYDIDTAVKTAAGTVFLFKDNQYVMSHDHGAKKEVKELLGAVRDNCADGGGGEYISRRGFCGPRREDILVQRGSVHSILPI